MSAQLDMMALHQRLVEGAAFQKSGDLNTADRIYRGVLAEAPEHPLALHLAAAVAASRGQFAQATDLYRRCVAIRPDDATAWQSLAQACVSVADYAGAMAAAERAIALSPQSAKSLYLYAGALQRQHDWVRAREILAKAQMLCTDPQTSQAILAEQWNVAQNLCDWDALERSERGLRETDGVLSPFNALAFADDPALHRHSAEKAWAAFSHIEAAKPAHRSRSDRIRVAYLSADFHEHATAYLMAELFERHDRDRFEWIGISWGPDDGKQMRRRLVKAFDQFWDVRGQDAVQIAQAMLEAGIDIAVDLKGHTEAAKRELFLHKPAPIIVNYLGYPGTMGASVYDYIVGDATVTPFDAAAHYSEQIVQMPHCYQVNDSRRAIAEQIPSRAEEGLPEQGFVFAAFNNTYKIRRAFFRIWMDLLKQTPGSVLWLVCDVAPVQQRLRDEAMACGVAPDRLVFARRVPLDQHLARHAHAGVLLDTLPYNAHTTSSDALWAGVPVVTCMGQAFAGRVAASLLKAVGLPELIAGDLDGYRALALRVAQDADYCEHLRAHLRSVRDSVPLFDAARFAGDLELAYEHMHERRLRGLSPQAFAVAELPKYKK